MALSDEQQSQIDVQVAIENIRQSNLIEFENLRSSLAASAENIRIKFEAVRLAKDILSENARSKPVDSRDVTSTMILNFADELVNYINN